MLFVQFIFFNPPQILVNKPYVKLLTFSFLNDSYNRIKEYHKGKKKLKIAI